MSASVWSHPLYQWYNTHSIYDIISTVYVAQYALYMTTHPWFMTSQHSTHDIKDIISHITLIISNSTSTVSLSSHPDYRWYNPHCIYDKTATICMTSYELHMTSHPLFMISHHAMTSHPLYSCHHTLDTSHHIHCSWTITYSVLIIQHLLYVWHETHYMHDIRGILYDITLTLYDVRILYTWCHIDSFNDSTPTLYDITYSIRATSQPQYLWQDTSYVHVIILSTYDISHGVWITIQPRYPKSNSQYLCNNIHLIDDITPYVCMKSHPLHVGHHRHYLCHQSLSWWRCLYVMAPTMSMTSYPLYMIPHTLSIWQHKLYVRLENFCDTHLRCDILWTI